MILILQQSNLSYFSLQEKKPQTWSMYVIVSQGSVHIFKTDSSACFINIKEKLNTKN